MLDVLRRLFPTRLAGRSAAIAKSNRFALEPKIDDVRGLIVTGSVKG